MPIEIEPVLTYRAILRVSAEFLVMLLGAMNGERHFRITGMPPHARVVGVRLERWGDHTIELLLEDDSFPGTPEGGTYPELDRLMVEELR